MADEAASLADDDEAAELSRIPFVVEDRMIEDGVAEAGGVADSMDVPANEELVETIIAGPSLLMATATVG